MWLCGDKRSLHIRWLQAKGGLERLGWKPLGSSSALPQREIRDSPGVFSSTTFFPSSVPFAPVFFLPFNFCKPEEAGQPSGLTTASGLQCCACQGPRRPALTSSADNILLLLARPPRLSPRPSLLRCVGFLLPPNAIFYYPSNGFFPNSHTLWTLGCPRCVSTLHLESASAKSRMV